MAWEWQAWRCFDHIRETIEEKGWKFRLDGHGDNGMVPPLVAESTGHYIAFFDRDPGTNECWFELRDKARLRVVFVRGVQSIPAPEMAAGMLASYGTPLGEMRSPRKLPLHSLPLAPMMPLTEAG